MTNKVIRFLVKSGNYNPGDIAGFPAQIADRAVARKYAVYHEPEKLQKEQKQAETQESEEEQTSGRKKLGKNKQMRASETSTTASYVTK